MGTDGQKSPALEALLVILEFFSFVTSLAGPGAAIQATADVYAGEEPTLSRSWQAGYRNACRLFCFQGMLVVVICLLIVPLVLVFLLVRALSSSDSELHQNVAPGVGLYLGLIWLGCFFCITVSFLVAPPSIVLEKQSVCGVYHRAVTLGRGRFCTIFCASFLMLPINAMICLIPVVGWLWELVTVPLQTSILATALFISLRVEKEGLNIHSLRDELGLEESTELRRSLYAGVVTNEPLLAVVKIIHQEESQV